MAEKLPCRPTVGALAIEIIDQIEGIARLQEALKLCQEEFSNPTDKSLLRIELLVDFYLAQVEYHIDELKWCTKRLEFNLKRVKQLIVAVDDDQESV